MEHQFDHYANSFSYLVPLKTPNKYNSVVGFTPISCEISRGFYCTTFLFLSPGGGTVASTRWVNN